MIRDRQRKVLQKDSSATVCQSHQKLQHAALFPAVDVRRYASCCSIVRWESGTQQHLRGAQRGALQLLEERPRELGYRQRVQQRRPGAAAEDAGRTVLPERRRPFDEQLQDRRVCLSQQRPGFAPEAREH